MTVRTLLRALGAVYFCAFLSFGVQAAGLVGSRGILPLPDYLRVFRQSLGPAAYWNAPSVFWIASSDRALALVWVLGCVCATAAVLGARLRLALAFCLVLWISICVAGQEFLGFQWDQLLSEAGFLALFADASAARILPFRWLAFRLMFFSGVVKLSSHDAVWRDLTALRYHYQTQPLPTPLAWFMHQLPAGMLKAQTAGVFVLELLVPLLFLGPAFVRRPAALATIAFQFLILLTGNYAYFNWLAILLALWLFVEPQPAPHSRSHRAVSAALLAFLAVATGVRSLEQLGIPLPPGGAGVLHLTAPLNIVNTYGLFANMTTLRPEIVVEGSNDGEHWAAYEFPYKPGDVRRPPPVVAPHQPRLDWQMWFAALGTYQENRWFVNFMVRLLQGEPAVLRLLAWNPFPQAPPRYIRARLFEYRFTTWGARAWWRREELGMYFPPVSLK